ncbi:Uncharacterised protein [Bordetella pertussis]|nr:Uncharacterised protein [Bordetella pertussis]CPO35925.1 Uncharacterised protein [Bordetella pertussis]
MPISVPVASNTSTSTNTRITCTKPVCRAPRMSSCMNVGARLGGEEKMPLNWL